MNSEGLTIILSFLVFYVCMAGYILFAYSEGYQKGQKECWNSLLKLERFFNKKKEK